MKSKLNIFGVQLILRIGLVCILCLGLGFSVVNKPFFFIPIILVLALCIAVVSLYFYLKKTNDNLYNFLLNLKHQDFQASFPKTNKNGNFSDVNIQYNDILRQFEKKQDVNKHAIAIMESALQQIKECVIIYKQDGEVAFMNPPFKEAFQIYEAKHIDDVIKIIPFPCFKLTDSRTRKWVLEPKDYDYIFTEPWHVEVKYTSVYNTHYKMCFFHSEPFNQQQNIKGWLSFVKVISHEIGNGITPIRSVAETISHDPILSEANSTRVGKGLDMIIKQADELLAFSERYRQLVQLPELKKEPMPFSEVFKELEDSFEYIFKEKKINFEYTGDVGIVRNIDKQLIKQAFSNLIINSIWALQNSKSPKINISVTQRREDVLVVFEDNGCGIPNDKKYQVFIPFYTSKNEGSGIGLSLTQQIIWKHNGRIFVESEPNVFTRFIVTFGS